MAYSEKKRFFGTPILLILGGLICVGGTFYWFSSKDSQNFGPYQFTSLRKGVVAEWDSQTLTYAEISDDHWRSLNLKLNELDKQEESPAEDLQWVATQNALMEYKLKKILAMIIKKATEQQKTSLVDLQSEAVKEVGGAEALKNQFWKISFAGDPQNEEELKLYENLARGFLQEDSLHRYYEKHFLKNRVRVDGKFFSWDKKVDVTLAPQLNKDSEKRIIYFCDFLSQACRYLHEGIRAFSVENKSWEIHFIPFYPFDDRYQLMLSELLSCVFKNDPQYYWDFLVASGLVSKEKFEEELFNILAENKKDVGKIKKCYLNREGQDIVEFYQKTAKYHGLTNGPLIFINQWPFLGPHHFLDLENLMDFVK